MKATKEALTQLSASRTYRFSSFRSKSNPSLVYRAAILYGGSMDRPKWECTCPGFQFNKKCRHVEELWDEMDGFSRSYAVHGGFNGEKLE
jgi:hypothetical protein